MLNPADSEEGRVATVTVKLCEITATLLMTKIKDEIFERLVDETLVRFYSEFGEYIAELYVDLFHCQTHLASYSVLSRTITYESTKLHIFANLPATSETAKFVESHVVHELDSLRMSLDNFLAICAGRGDCNAGILGNRVERISEERTPVHHEQRDLLERQKKSFPYALVASDSHLGRRDSRKNAFYECLAKTDCQLVILNGDILDYWIATDTKGPSLADVVISEWEKLYSQLQLLQTQGVRTVYVPGNHDYASFLIEGSETLDWCKSLVNRIPLLGNIKRETRNKSLCSVAEIHYPFFLVEAPATNDVLVSHGHYHQWWRRITRAISTVRRDDPEDPFLIAEAQLMGIATATGLKYAPQLRQAFKTLETIGQIQHIQDLAINITAAVAGAFTAAANRFENDPEELSSIVDEAFVIYLGNTSNISHGEQARILAAIRCVAEHATSDNSKELRQCYRRTKAMLKSMGDSANYAIKKTTLGGHSVQIRPFHDFLSTKQLIVGHFHKPRSLGDVHDAGSFCENNETFLQISLTGAVSFPM